MSDTLNLKGYVKAVLRGTDGKIKKVFENHNTIVTVGKNALAAWLCASSQSTQFMPYIGVGTGNTSPAIGNTALVAEVGTRVTSGWTASGNVITASASFAAGNATATIAEAGAFSASTSGTLFSRVLIGPFTKASIDTLTITWSVTLS